MRSTVLRACENSFHNILCQAWWCHSDVFMIISVWAWRQKVCITHWWVWKTRQGLLKYTNTLHYGKCRILCFWSQDIPPCSHSFNQSGLITIKEEECCCSLWCISLLEVACRLAPELSMEGYWKDSLHTLCIYCWEFTTEQPKCSSQMSALQHKVNSCPATLV